VAGTKRYTAEQFIKAIDGTGGVISAIAAAVGCDWHTAKKYINGYATIKQAYDNERNKITDKARHNIIKAIGSGDLQMSKWWLQVMDEEFRPATKHEHSGRDGGPIETKTNVTGIDAGVAEVVALLDAARKRSGAGDSTPDNE